MTTHDDYLKRYPTARTSTLVFLAQRAEKTEQLRREIEAAKAQTKAARGPLDMPIARKILKLFEGLRT
jgi:hypothetical protein